MMNEKRKEEVRLIQNVITDVLNEYMSDGNVEIANMFTALRVTNNDWSLNIWIRLYTYEPIIVDFSSIEIPIKLRRKGLFTKIFKEIAKLNCVGDIRVTSVVTDEMRSWCTKNKLKQRGDMDYIYEK